MFFVEEVFYKKFIITCCWYSLCCMYCICRNLLLNIIHEHVQLHATFVNVHDVVPNIVVQIYYCFIIRPVMNKFSFLIICATFNFLIFLIEKLAVYVKYKDKDYIIVFYCFFLEIDYKLSNVK